MRRITVALFLLPALLGHPLWAQSHKGKIITTYVDGNTTKMIIEAKEALIAGRNVYVGPKGIPVTVDDLLSRSKGLYYYSAKVAGKVKIEKGAEVRTQPTRELKIPSILRNDAGSGITFGGGLLLQSLGFDYAFVPFGDLGHSHRFSLSYRW